MDSVLEHARRYVAAGLSVIPVRADGSKAPALKAGEVEQYRERYPTDAELVEWFGGNRAVGLAVVCGKISGNLAVMDFETDEVWNRWLNRVIGTPFERLVSVCPLVRTPNGGRHLYCRIAESWVAGGGLAWKADRKVSVEIRGQGHYVVAPGSPMACHATNRPYTFVSEGWLRNG